MSRPRFAGDGIDTRRPVMSDPPLIDLTGAESPEPQPSPQPTPSMRRYPGGLPPRLNVEPAVIDLEAELADAPERQTPPVDLTGPTPIDLEDDEDDDEVQFMGSQQLPQPNTAAFGRFGPSDFSWNRLLRLGMPHAMHGLYRHRAREHESRLRRQQRRWAPIERRFQQHERAAGTMSAGGADRLPYSSRRAAPPPSTTTTTAQPVEPPVEPGPTSSFGYIPSQFPFDMNVFQQYFRPPAQIRLPRFLNYDNAAFNTETGAPTRPPRPTYSAPPAVKDGFTRSPREDDVLLCPNCDHELGTGEGLDGQVWAIRDCGHVYCGFCAGTRQQPGSKKSAAAKLVRSLEEQPRRQEKLKTCAADDCTGKTNGKHKMFQVFVSVD